MRRPVLGRHGIRFGTAALAAALVALGSVRSSQGNPPASPTNLSQTPPLHAQAGVESTVAPTLVVQPGPPPIPLGGEPQLRGPGPPGASRPALPDFESDADAANLRVAPSVEPAIDGERENPSKEAGTGRQRQP